MSTDTPVKASLRHRLYHGETAYDFVGGRRKWAVLSGAVILAGVISLFTQGLNYGIDFKGGTSWEVEAPDVSVSEARDALEEVDLGSAKIQKVQAGRSDRLRVQGPRFSGTAEEIAARQGEVTDVLVRLANAPDAGAVSVNDVGPSWGDDVTKKARNALIVFFVLISIYISLRFEWKMAVAALSAVVHDILVTIGVYSISRFEVTPATVVAFLTILGYSLYDTIVVFDKVEENTKSASSGGRMTYSDVVNLSMNQVLMRSLNTSLVAILPILSVLLVGAGILGAVTLKDFGLALLVGLITGAYSSIFVASPMLAVLKEREPRYAAIRQRAASKGGSGLLTPAAAAAAAGRGGRGRSAAAGSDGAGDDGAHGEVPRSASAGRPATGSGPRPNRPPASRSAPRPRKKGKRR